MPVQGSKILVQSCIEKVMRKTRAGRGGGGEMAREREGRLPLIKPANSPSLIKPRHALGMLWLSRETFVTAGSGERRIYSQAINS